MLIGRSLGPSDFGTLWAAFLVARYLSLIADWGALIRGPRDVARQDWPLVRSLVRHRTRLGVMLAALYATVTVVGGFAWLAPMAAVVLARGLNRDWIAIGQERGLIAGVPNLVQGVIVAVLAATLSGSFGAVSAVAIGYTVGLAVSVAANRLPAGGSTGDTPIEGWMLGGVLGDQISQTADVLLLAAVKSPADAGIYAAAYRIPNAWYTLLGLLTNGLVPLATDVAQNEPERLPVLRKRALKRSALGGAVLAAAAPALALLVEPLFGSGFAGGSVPAGILLVAVAIATVGAPLHALYLGTGQNRNYATVLIAGGLLNLAANAVLIPVGGKVGAAVATLASTTAVQVLVYVRLCRAERELAPPDRQNVES